MCRGCEMLKDGEPTTDEYLQWLDEYEFLTRRMKRLEKRVDEYGASLDSRCHQDAVDAFRRKLIRARKEYGAANEALNKVWGC